MRRRGADEPKRDERRSIYESRELTWLDRLRRLVGGEESPAPIELNEWGKPTLVAINGECVGVRDVNGALVRFPEVPANRLDLWPDEWWDRVGEFRPWW